MLLVLGCAVPGDATTIALRWVRGSDETWDQARMGMEWDLSNVGVRPPGFGDIEAGADGATFTLSVAGFPRQVAWEEAIAPLRASDEVAVFGAMDVGRFLALTVYAPDWYYALSGACPTLDEWEALRLVDVEGYLFTESLIMEDARAVRFDVARVALTATSRHGEHETVDVMENGQSRFAVYDAEGALVPYAVETAAGKPGKCQWCHEGDVQHGDPANPDYARWDARASVIDAEMLARRSTWPEPLDEEAHDWGEWLIANFLEPSPDRVARELGVARSALPDLPTHADEEYPEWGALWERADVDAIADGWTPLPVQESVREAGEGEEFDLAGVVACEP